MSRMTEERPAPGDGPRRSVPLKELRTMRCPTCLRVNNAASAVEPDVLPKEDDRTLCWQCEHLAVYAYSPVIGWHQRLLGPAELAEAEREPEVVEARRQVRQAKSAGAPPSSMPARMVDPWWEVG